MKLTFQAGDFRAALQAIRHAMTTEETRYYLRGVYLQSARDDQWNLVATDGHRMGVTRIRAIPNGPMPTWQGILPADWVNQVASAKKQKEWYHYELDLSDEMVRIGLHGAAEPLVGKLVDGTFPDYCRVMPTGTPEHGAIELPAKNLKLALQALCGFVKPIADVNAVRLSFEKESVCRLLVKMTNYHWQSAGASVSIELAKPIDAPDIGFDAFRLLDIVKSLIPSLHNTIELRHYGPSNPAIFCVPGQADHLQFVLMPTRI